MRIRLTRLFLIALAFRLLFMLVYSLVIPVHFSARPFHGWEMGWIAINLAQGRGFSNPLGPGTEPTAWLCPLIPFLWAGIIKVTGEISGHTEAIIVFLQAIASSLSVVLYVAIFRRLVPNAPAWIARIFIIALVLWPESYFRLINIWYHSWQELALAALVWYGLDWYEQGTTRAAVVLGVVGGIAGLINVSPAPVFVILLLAPFRRVPFRRIAIGALVAFLFVAPWLVRNRLVFHRFIAMRGNVGIELLQGNNPIGAVKQRSTSLHPYHTPEERVLFQQLGEAEYNRLAGRRALAWMRENPGRAALLVLQRAYVAWCTDLTDNWSWTEVKWWQTRFTLVQQSVTILCALVPLILAIWGVFRAKWAQIPHKFALFAPFLATLPHYFTQVEDAYVYYVRLWLLLLAAVAFSISSLRSDAPELRYRFAKRLELLDKRVH